MNFFNGPSSSGFGVGFETKITLVFFYQNMYSQFTFISRYINKVCTYFFTKYLLQNLSTVEPFSMRLWHLWCFLALLNHLTHNN